MDYPKDIQDKLAQLRSYVPFVQRMISKLEVHSQQVGASHGQLERLRGLHGFLTSPIPRAPRMEMLEKMEAVIRSMQDKVHRAQGKPLDSSPDSGSDRFPQEVSHPRTGSSSFSDPRTSVKHAMGPGRDFLNLGKATTGLMNSSPRTHQHSPSARSGSADWQSKKDPGGRGEKPPFRREGQMERSRERGTEPAREGQMERPRERGTEPAREGQMERPRERGTEPAREGSNDRNRRESERSDARHGERSRDRGSERSREKEYERSKSREYEHRREMDSHRSEREARLRIPSDKEFDRRQGNSKEREHERDKGRDFGKALNSQERNEHGKEKEHRHRSQDRSSGDKDRRHAEGRSVSEKEKTQSDGKSSAKWNSLLDLPMPPPTVSQDLPHSSSGSKGIGMNDEKFQNSREKLQRLFGIQGEPSGSKEREGKSASSKSRGWREEVRARKDNFFSQRSSSQGSGDIDERLDNHPLRHKLQLKEPSRETSHPSTAKTFPKTQTTESRENAEQWKSGTRMKNENFGSSRDTPLSPDQSPVPFEALDTPMSPDVEAAFSPSIPPEEFCSPVKTIPLENVQQKGVDLETAKTAPSPMSSSEECAPARTLPIPLENIKQKGVDLEAIKKALAQIRASEKKSETSDNQGASYRYEDFVGPASSSKMEEDEPYDPEEIWNSQALASLTLTSSKFGAALIPKSVDTDLRVVPKDVTSMPQDRQGGAQGGPPKSAPPSGISPQRQTSIENQRSSAQASMPGHTVTQASMPGQAGWFQSGPMSKPGSSGDTDMRLHHSMPTLPRHQLMLPKPQESSSPKLPQPSPFQSPPLQPPPLPPASIIPQRSSSSRLSEDSPDQDTHSYSGSRLDGVRSRIAHKSGELIKPGQQGVAASQMEKYKLKKQLTEKVPEIKSPSSLGSSFTKLDMGNKRKESVSLLDMLLPENSEANVEENSQSVRDPHKIIQPPRDPRLKPPDPPEADALSGAAHGRDPRLSGGVGLSRDPRHQVNRDPRNEAAKFPTGLHREDLSRHYGVPGSINRDPRQELRKVSHGAPLSRDPRHELTAARGSKETAGFPLMAASQNRDPRHELSAANRDPRHELSAANRDPRHELSAANRDPRHELSAARVSKETPGFPLMAASQIRDPRIVSRGDRTNPVWPQHQPPLVSATNYGVQAASAVAELPATQSASGSLIGDSFTCLMMRGLPPFANTNHIYHFFQEYILRDISIELDNHFICKGTAYVHFPSHNSALDALEVMNGHFLQGSVITLRICTVGILRQAKNAYENLNREREARLGIPDRPRGNGNPFFKPRPKEPLIKPPSSKPTSDVSESTNTKTQVPAEGSDGSTAQYSDLCGIKVPPKSPISFKIPKIRKEEPKQKDASKDESTSKSQKKPAISKGVTEPSSKDSSESEDDLQNVKVTNTKTRKFKKIVIASDSESDNEEPKKSENKSKKKSTLTPTSCKESSQLESKTVSEREATVAADDIEDDENNDDVDDDGDDDDDEGYMVIDETVLSDTEESEVGSQMSEEPSDLGLTSKDLKKKNRKPKTKKKNNSKQKLRKKSGSMKGKKKVQSDLSSGKKAQKGKKHTDKYMSDNSYKPELALNSSVGMKLTRHTQGELEELLPEQKKLRVLIPTPLKIVTTICEDVKVKKKGGMKAVETVAQPIAEPSESPKIPTVRNVRESTLSVREPTVRHVRESTLSVRESSLRNLKETPQPETKRKTEPEEPKKQDPKRDSQRKSNTETPVILPVDSYWEYTAKYGTFGEILQPENTHLMVSLKKSVSVATPTSRKGKKRRLTSRSNNPSKKPRSNISSGLSGNQKSDAIDVDRKEDVDGSLGEDTLETCSGTEKRSLAMPSQGNDSKKLCVERPSSKSEDSFKHFDLFAANMLSDDPDLMQITPTLLDVDPTISSALPNASALANMLSPPHMSHSASENMNHKGGVDSIWTTDKHLADDEEKLPYDITKSSLPENVKDLSDHVMDDDLVLEEMISIAMKTADAEESREQINFGDIITTNEVEDFKGSESNEFGNINIEESSEVNVGKKGDTSGNELNEPATESTEQEVKSIIPVVKEDSDKQSATVSAQNELFNKDKLFSAQVKVDSFDKILKSVTSFDKILKSVSDLGNVSNDNAAEIKVDNEETCKNYSRTTSDESLKINSEEATGSESTSGKQATDTLAFSKISESDAANSSVMIDAGIQEDTDDADDVASVGKVSTCSFVDDASIVSSEGHDVKTFESQPRKRGRKKKNKKVRLLGSMEVRRVTRGSVVEPLTAEHVEWDDGGVVGLFQCDQCDYVGRHIAFHLVNFHTDRELPCEFKKEDFSPVIKDYVGPPLEASKESVSLNLKWIPNTMNFKKNITCKECDYCSKSRFDLIYHYLEHFPKATCSVYHCRLCNYMSEKKASFYNHVSSHTGEYRFRCELCGHKTYKKELLQSHHKESHKSQTKSFSEDPMTEEDGWLYIYVCKVCMFVRISLEAAENHVQLKHSGRADSIHKANMSRPVVLHSESRKAGNESESTPVSRPRFIKGKKRKKGKKLPAREVFVGDEEEDEEIEEKAKQLVDRISSNIHTTMSVQEANKRMSLLNSISKKLDEETEDDTMEVEEPDGESKPKEELPVDALPACEASQDKSQSSSAKEETNIDEASEKTTAVQEPNSSEEKVTHDIVRRLKYADSVSTESDSESTMSAIEPDTFEDDLVLEGKGSLQDTIKKLYSKLEISPKKDEPKQEIQSAKKDQERPTIGQSINSSGGHDNDSDSDTLVICEDGDSDKDGDAPTKLPQDEQSAKQPASSAESTKVSLQDSIHSILREASSKAQDGFPMPKLRIRPAHQLIEPSHSPKKQKEHDQQGKNVPIATVFKCCVRGCHYSSHNNMDLIQHIISNHGPYKCIASGCRFVTKSKELYEIHHLTLHPKLNFVVCPFHCKNVFRRFSELLSHLTDVHANQCKEEEQLEEDSEIPGFLKIESVSTLDPAAASQMFGDDYANISKGSTSPSIQFESPTKMTATNIPGISIGSPPSHAGSYITTTVSPSSSESIITITPAPQTSKPSTTSQSSLGFIPLSSIMARSKSTVASSPPAPAPTKSSQQKVMVTIHSSTSSKKSSQPTYVTIDDEEGHEEKDPKPPPPGLATLPRTPPTVPIQVMFQVYQTTDVFKTYITKLAPEVFKCMYNGCIFAEDDSEAFINHIREHEREYRCCYCLVLMGTPEFLVQHIVTEHSHCQYQCRYCLYRALTKIYMGVHLKNFHPHEEPRYIKVETIQPHPPPNPPIDQFVRPYRCTFEECQYRTVDAEAFRTHVNNHGPFVILSCDFCHKHLHVIPLIDHMREHHMNEYQCPYCLHGDAEKERLLSHLLNCHSGRPGKVLLRKQIPTAVSSAAPCPDKAASQPPPPAPVVPESNSSSEVLKTQASESSSKPEEEEKDPLEIEPGFGQRMASRTSSTELDGAKGHEDNSNLNQATGGDDSFLQAAEKTGLSGHALNRCGNEGCEYSSLSQIELREHLQVCDLAQDSTVLRCHHCGKQVRHLCTLLDHLRVHGPKRYRCGVTGCDYRATMVHYFKNHMKQIHRCSGFKQLMLKDSKNRDPENQEYVVYPKDAVPTTREGHRKRKNEYGIEDILRIPRAHVSYQELKCYHCTFVSKVRLNLIKHIKLHEKYPEGIPQMLNISSGSNFAIPCKQPLNPVPCLDRKELMFDKMMNLAGSSFEQKRKKEDSDLRAKNPISPEEHQRLPKHVPEERLYTCGIEGCNYLSCDDMMLKYHIRTLHAHATTFPCPHCVGVSITVEKMSSHFKLHGERLYRCGWCHYVSSRRNIVERHMKDKHQSKKAFDFVIREPEDPDAPKKPDDKPSEEPVVVAAPQPVPQDPQWQCGLCTFSSVTQQEILNHTSLKHSIRSQFKCGYCSVRSSVRASFDAHFAAKHPNQQFRVLCMYYRLDSEDIEPLNHGDAQHMHEPLWKRNDPERIRHIRGILIDDDPETKKNWFKQTGKGKADKDEFVCPKCGSFRTACASTFRSHLCREASYDRYQCVECGASNSLLPTLQRHYTKMHHAPFTSECYLQLPVEEEKEAWVELVVSHQQDLIKKWQEKGDADYPGESPSGQHQTSPVKSGTSRRSSTNASSLSSETNQEVGGIVLHDSGSERGRFVCDVCGSECRSAAGLKSHTTAMHQARYKCHYCPFASNSEDAVKQHSSTKHPRLQIEVIDVSQRSNSQKEDTLLCNEILSPEKAGGHQRQEEDVSPSLESSANISLESSAVSLQSVEEMGYDTYEETIEDSQPTMARIYSCPFCVFTTNSSSGLNHHKRNKHIETRLFLCLYCKARFYTNQDALRHHKWKHMPEVPKIVRKTYDKAEESGVSEQTEVGHSEGSEIALSSKSNTSPKLIHPKPIRAKARKSFPNASLASVASNSSRESASSLQTLAQSNLSSEPTYTCCHCSQQSTKSGMEEHMKKQHRDLPYQVRREKKDRIFTEVHIYKCIHCIVESISLAQAMDHWIQNHPLLEFKFGLVLRHSGEVSNQVVSSTTIDKDSAHDAADTESQDNVKTTREDGGITTTIGISSSSDITSSSESSKPGPLRYREGQKDTASPRHSLDGEEEITDLSEEVGNKKSEVRLSSEGKSEDMMYKCGLCKKSTERLPELQAHISKIHPDRDVKIKKLPREVFDQLYRAEYKCNYCSERGRHTAITKHHKLAHPGLPAKLSRLPQPPRGNVYFRCDVCGHVVKNLQSVRLHLRRHHPETNDFTFSKLTLGSPMRPPVKQPFKCNYCGDVGETLEEMHTHHTFMHSHLERNITNLMDEALSSLHSPSTSHSGGETKISSSVALSVSNKNSPSVQTAGSGMGKQSEDVAQETLSGNVPASAVPSVLQCKNTARKSTPLPVKRAVAMKSTSKPHVVVTGDEEEEDSVHPTDQPSLGADNDNVYAFVTLGGGAPMRLTAEQLGRLVNLKPQLELIDFLKPQVCYE